MITLTKIFRFESAHAINGYPGACANIHGHSYELHVKVAEAHGVEGFIKGTGIVMDFKELKRVVQESVINQLDHKVILSRGFLKFSDIVVPSEGLLVFEHEPTAENLLIFIKDKISNSLPTHIKLISLKLFETYDSCAEWLAS